ncbi:MAG: hypothetical protein GF307_13560 [candidate division Zixibacteria bacterium]|nr:hypothetical protein [candidate division Zixibacteria bacterium]
MRNIKIILALLIALTFVSSSTADPLLGECQPYGDVLYNGEPVEDGLAVKVYIEEDCVAEGTTAGGGYSVIIPPDNPDTQQREGWATGDIVTIEIDGKVATPSFEAFMGSKRYNLRVATLDVKLDTWGKIKALFK